jgi:hypothetical protein
VTLRAGVPTVGVDCNPLLRHSRAALEGRGCPAEIIVGCGLLTGIRDQAWPAMERPAPAFVTGWIRVAP